MRDFFSKLTGNIRIPEKKEVGIPLFQETRTGTRSSPGKKRNVKIPEKGDGRRILPPFLPCLLAYFFSFDVSFFSLVRIRGNGVRQLF